MMLFFLFLHVEEALRLKQFFFTAP